LGIRYAYSSSFAGALRTFLGFHPSADGRISSGPAVKLKLRAITIEPVGLSQWRMSGFYEAEEKRQKETGRRQKKKADRAQSDDRRCPKDFIRQRRISPDFFGLRSLLADAR